MRSKYKSDLLLTNTIIIHFCLIITIYAAIPFNNGGYKSSSYNSNKLSGAVTQFYERGSRTPYDGSNYQPTNIAASSRAGPPQLQPISRSNLLNNSPTHKREAPQFGGGNAGKSILATTYDPRRNTSPRYESGRPSDKSGNNLLYNFRPVDAKKNNPSVNNSIRYERGRPSGSSGNNLPDNFTLVPTKRNDSSVNNSRRDKSEVPSGRSGNNLADNFKPNNRPVPSKTYDPRINYSTRYNASGSLSSASYLPVNFQPNDNLISQQKYDPSMNNLPHNTPRTVNGGPSRPSINNITDNFRPTNRSDPSKGNHISSQENLQRQPKLNPQSFPKPNHSANNSTLRPLLLTNGTANKQIASKFLTPGKSDASPAVLFKSNLNASNKLHTNTTLPAQIGENKLSSNNITQFSIPGKADVTPVVSKQSRLNASNNISKSISTGMLNPPLIPRSRNNNETARSGTKVAETLRLFNMSNMASNEIGLNKFQAGFSSNNKSTSSIMKTLSKELRKFRKKFYTIDYGRPFRNKGSNLKAIGGNIINSITVCFIAIAAAYAII